MFDEEDSPSKGKAGFSPAMLDNLSIEDLEDYIGALEAEIARARKDIDAKKSARSGADAFFKAP